MSLKSVIARPLARWVTLRNAERSKYPVKAQQAVLAQLLDKGAGTAFGKDHRLSEVLDHHQLIEAIPLRDYESLKPYIDRVIAGEKDVLWPGAPLYLCKTSGTTSGAKYIPMTREVLSNEISGARNALFAYVHHSGNSDFLDGKMIFLQGSPELDKKGAVPSGRLSGIVANHVPGYLQRNRLPSYATNTIPDWETKVEAIVHETLQADMRLISGIPAWVQQYFEKLLERSGAGTVKELFPNFSLFVHGGVNFAPYRSRMETLIGGVVDSIETFPASEGFFAYQDRFDEEGMLLIVDDAIYYEFLPVDGASGSPPKRLSIAEVQIGVNYALVLHTKAGLWGYELGDTVRFVSLSPPRIIVTGRTKHFTSAFGEHVIAEEVESALREAMQAHPCDVAEFTVAPQTDPPSGGLPYHEWFIEFSNSPSDLDAFAASIDNALQKRNPYYKDLIAGKVLRSLVITALERGTFARWMKERGMNDAQSKVPRLANDRRFVQVSG